MITPGYQEMLDELLRPGLAGLSQTFVDSQAGFVSGCQQPDGGFPGRQGGSDLYYSDFALRVLCWLAPQHPAIRRAADCPLLLSPARRMNPAAATWAANPALGARICDEPGSLAAPASIGACSPRDAVECFNFLNILRLLKRASAGEAGANAMRADSLLAGLERRRLLAGGFARWDNDDRVSAYHTFLSGLCYQMLDAQMPAAQQSVQAIQSLHRAGGGYAELADQSSAQTSATAAAVGFLMMHNALPPEQSAAAAAFLAGMQSADGGLRPHAGVEGGDLLSTFTGLLTLVGLDRIEGINLSAVAEFLRRTAHPKGGFTACPSDDTADVEYTYYGIATLALLHVLIREA